MHFTYPAVLVIANGRQKDIRWLKGDIYKETWMFTISM